MQIFQTKTKKISGTNYRDVSKKAFKVYSEIKKGTKRRPYVRSAYFHKDKIFLELFWQRLYEKQNFRDKIRRMRYFNCAVELIKISKIKPISKENPNKSSEILHRFMGITAEKDLFCIQIKENKQTSQKWLISVFPFRKNKKTLR